MASTSAAEIMALAEIAKARRMNLVRMFTGTRLTFGLKAKAKAAKDLVTKGKKVHSEAGKLGSGSGGNGTQTSSGGNGASKFSSAAMSEAKKAAEQFLTNCADVGGIQDVVEALTENVVAEIVSEITPYFGIVKSGVKAAQAGKAVATDGYHLYKSKTWRSGFLPGDPAAAAEAVRDIIKRDIAKHSVDFTRHTASTGLKIAGCFADLGTATTAAVGTANALAGLGLTLYALGLDIKDMKKGNKRLETPNTLDNTVFSESPILGCYLITCSDTSSVANFMVSDIGMPGWMDKVEHLKKTQMDPLIKVAKKGIDSSKLQLEGLQSNKGTHMEPSFFAKMKSKAVRRLKG
jgi:hypothetical protein